MGNRRGTGKALLVYASAMLSGGMMLIGLMKLLVYVLYAVFRPVGLASEMFTLLMVALVGFSLLITVFEGVSWLVDNIKEPSEA